MYVEKKGQVVFNLLYREKKLRITKRNFERMSKNK